MIPFVKWAGGKRQLANHLHALMPTNYQAYYEPFLGGAALLFFVQPTVPIYINDVNAQLIHVYRTIRDSTEEFINTVNELDVSVCNKERYYYIRECYNRNIVNQVFDVKTAALFVYLNKHCFNGLYRVNMKGLFNVPWNHKEKIKSIDEANIRNIAMYLRHNEVTITNGDFELACESCKEGDFVYFDSPYDILSKTSSFVDYTKESFKEEDHIRLAALYRRLTKRGVFCLLTNHGTPLIRKLYDGFSIEEVEVQRAINSDASKRRGREVIIRNY